MNDDEIQQTHAQCHCVDCLQVCFYLAISTSPKMGKICLVFSMNMRATESDRPIFIEYLYEFTTRFRHKCAAYERACKREPPSQI